MELRIVWMQKSDTKRKLGKNSPQFTGFRQEKTGPSVGAFSKTTPYIVVVIANVPATTAMAPITVRRVKRSIP